MIKPGKNKAKVAAGFKELSVLSTNLYQKNEELRILKSNV